MEFLFPLIPVGLAAIGLFVGREMGTVTLPGRALGAAAVVAAVVWGVAIAMPSTAAGWGLVFIVGVAAGGGVAAGIGAIIYPERAKAAKRLVVGGSTAALLWVAFWVVLIFTTRWGY